jgi:hypothetical protein
MFPFGKNHRPNMTNISRDISKPTAIVAMSNDKFLKFKKKE